MAICHVFLVEVWDSKNLALKSRRSPVKRNIHKIHIFEIFLGLLIKVFIKIVTPTVLRLHGGATVVPSATVSPSSTPSAATLARSRVL